MGKNKKKAPDINSEKYGIYSWEDLNWKNLKNVIYHNSYAKILIVLTIIGFSLRFYQLGFNSLWLDEGATYDFARRSLEGIWMATTGGEFNPPLFYYLEHIMLLFGDSEVILRAIPALLGTLTIPVLYFVGREVSGRIGGILAAALLTFSTFHIYYSQEARAYTTVLFFFTLAILWYLLAIKSDSWKHWILCGVFCSLAFWTHFYVFIGIGILFLHAFIVKRHELMKNPKTAITTVGAGLLTFILVSLPLILVTIDLFFKRTASTPTWGLSGTDIITNTVILISGSEIYLTIIFTLLTIIGVAVLWIDEKKRDIALLLVFSIILPLICSMILSAYIPMSPRYLIFILPFWFVSIATASGIIPKDVDHRKVATIAIILIFLISVPYLSTYYTNYSKNDWRGFSETLTSITHDGDYVITCPGYMSLPLDYYYDNTTDKTIETSGNSEYELMKVERERGNSSAYYIVTGDITAANPEGDVLRWLSENTEYLGANMGINLFKSKGVGTTP